MLKQYKDIFGKPRTGLHKYRVFDAPIIDYVGSVIIAIGLSKWLHLHIMVSLLLVLIMSIVMHHIFGVDTNTQRFLNFHNDYEE